MSNYIHTHVRIYIFIYLAKKGKSEKVYMAASYDIKLLPCPLSLKGQPSDGSF